MVLLVLGVLTSGSKIGILMIIIGVIRLLQALILPKYVPAEQNAPKQERKEREKKTSELEDALRVGCKTILPFVLAIILLVIFFGVILPG